jgi:tetratricopeptide (TPR) repeat protein
VELNGADSIQVATATNNVATALAAQGKLAQAVEMFGETFEQHVRLLGTSHWRTANAARNAAMGLLFLERADEAQVWMDRAVAAHDASTGADAMGTAYVRAQQARVLDALGKRREAIALLRSSIATIAELAPPEGIYGLADARQWLGRALLADGAPQQAELLFQEALAFRRRVQPDGHPQRAIAECDLARALNALGRRAEARTLLDRCVPTVAQYALIEAPLRRDVIRLREQLRAAAVDR